MNDPLELDVEPGFKNESIGAHLRRQIVEGALAPGSQLPSRRQLEQLYRASRDTVQRALERLVEEEFVYTNGRNGTYVSPHPPHLSHYGLVFQNRPRKNSRTWSQFEETLLRAATNRAPDPGQALRIYYDIESRKENSDYQRLEQDVLNHHLSGLIFAFDPASLRGTPLMEIPWVTRVTMRSIPLQMPTVSFSMTSFMDRALDFMVLKGRRRVALLSHAPSRDRDNRYFREGLAARGLVFKRYWIQTANVRTPESADECVHLLMHDGQVERPDAIVIDNDNLLEPALQGLVAAGARVPEDVEVVSHANYPLPRSSPLPVPVTRLGFDIAGILDACFESLRAQRDGAGPVSTTVGALFEGEVGGKREAVD